MELVAQSTLRKFVKTLMRISDEEKQNEGFEREIETFRAINHPNLLELFEVIYDEDRVHLVTEYMNVASLINLVNRLPMGRFTEADAKFIMTQVVRGVEHLHQRNIAHLDIKLDNIFVRIKNQGYVFKLGDFDCSQLGENVVIKSGTPCYLSPEVFIEHGVGISGKQCDMWALGVSLFLMINGTLPFDGATPLDIAQSIVNGHIKWSHNEVKVDQKCS